MLSTWSEQQGQTSISDPDKNLGFTIIVFIRYARIISSARTKGEDGTETDLNNKQQRELQNNSAMGSTT